MAMSAQSVTITDDERVRVTRWTFPAGGDDTGHHTHQYDYLVVPVTGGTFTVTDQHGATRHLTQRAGEPYLGTAGTAHNVTSSSGIPAVFVEIELKK
jgi:beta-alanine degradation protein BauB